MTEAYIREYPEEFVASTVDDLRSVVPRPTLVQAPPKKEEDPLSPEVAHRNAAAISTMFGSLPSSAKARG